MGIRLNFITEGQTEETFFNVVLRPHLADHHVWGYARRVETGRRQNVIYRGGLRSYAKAKNDLVLWIKQDHNPDVAFTTMFDLYALPKDFPGYEEAQEKTDPYVRVKLLEKALHDDIDEFIPGVRFIPYIQLHEFESLILADPQKLDSEYLEHDRAIHNLVQMAAGFDSPELINDKHETCPSRRIITEIPEYEGMKASAGPLVAAKIGIPMLRTKCRHFGEWLVKLESLGKNQATTEPNAG